MVLGTAPDGDSELTVEAIRRAARHAKLQVLTGVLGDRLVVIAGGSDNPLAVAKSLIGPYAAGPVVAGPVVPDLLAATRSAQAAAAGLKACFAWQDAPRPVLADDLLPERAIAGDPSAREQLVEEIYRPLEEGRRGAARDAQRVSRAGEQPRRRGADAVRSPQHRSLPAPTCDRRHRLVTLRCTLGVHPADRADPGASGRW